MREQRYYMACLDLTGRECVVVGGGKVGLEKVRGLLECGASVRVVAPEIERKLADLPVRWLESRYQGWDLDDAWLAVAATPDREVNRRVFEDAQQRGIFCNVADDPELCSLILPAVHRIDPIAVAVSTGGASPALAKRLRSMIAAIVRPEHAALAEELRALRPEVKARFASYEERRDYFEEIVREQLS